jgi:hypothetical protein
MEAKSASVVESAQTKAQSKLIQDRSCGHVIWPSTVVEKYHCWQAE